MKSNTMSVYREDYATEREYRKAYQDADRQYSFKARVDGGWKFFAYSSDYDTWRGQR